MSLLDLIHQRVGVGKLNRWQLDWIPQKGAEWQGAKSIMKLTNMLCECHELVVIILLWIICWKLPCWVHLPWDTLTRPKWDQPASPDHQALHCIPAVKGNNHKYYQLIMLRVPIYVKGLRMRYPISRRLSASQFKKKFVSLPITSSIERWC